MKTITETSFIFENQTGFYRGKVRDVYYLGNNMVIIATDRISAFDIILPRPIPLKGQILNQLAAYFLQATSDICPNWLLSVPDENASFGIKCEPFQVEMVIRGYLAGHAWREYNQGKRTLCGVSLPDGLKENDKLPNPIITPSTKAYEGHDEDKSRESIIAKGIVSEAHYEQLELFTLQLFERGTKMAADRGLILVDTKYEFGIFNNKIHLIDEIHTPDSSRYFYKEGYEENSPVNFTDQLKGNYLLIHGLTDDNVHFQHTAEMANQLILNNKQYDTMIYPNRNHSIGDKAAKLHLYRKMTKFLTENMNNEVKP